MNWWVGPGSTSMNSFSPAYHQTDKKEFADYKESPLEQSISFTDKITLRYDQSRFSLDFAALGYTAPQNLIYAYKIEGLSDN